MIRCSVVTSARSASALALVFTLTGCKLDPLPNPDTTPPPPPPTGACEPNAALALSASVEVIRDTSGFAHIYAANAVDASFASGYMQASDRLYDMQIMRMRALGRAASVFGPSRVTEDTLLRLLDMKARGKENVELLRAEQCDTYRVVEAWVAGVNRRIDEIARGEVPMPVGFAEAGMPLERFTPDEAMAIGKLIVFGNGNQLEYDILATAISRLSKPAYDALPFYEPITDAFILPDIDRKPPSPGAPPPRPPLGGAKASHARAAHSDVTPTLDPKATGPQLDQVAFGRAFAAWSKSMAGLRPGASNNWAIRGEHTDNGRSMIAGDPHQGLRSPTIWWAHHMNAADGSLDVIGWSFVGTPGVSLGHNRHVAWTATTNYPDVTDIWLVDGDETSISIGGKTVPVETRTETLEIKGADPKQITLSVVPGYGVLLPNDFLDPLISAAIGASSKRLLFNWTGLRPTREAHTFYLFDRATTIEEFEQGVKVMELGSFNWVGATKDAIRYRSPALTPKRPAGAPPAYLALPADDPTTLWTAYFTEDEQPHSSADVSGVIVSANNDPFGFTGDGTLTNDPFYYGAFYDPGTRAKRIRDRIDEITATRKVTLDDMESIQTDTYAIVADELIPLAQTAIAAKDTDASLAEFDNRPELDAIVAELVAWDRKMERTEKGAVVFEAFSSFLARRTIGDDLLKQLLQAVTDNQPIFVTKLMLLALRKNALIPQGINRAVLEAIVDTNDFLETRFGGLDASFTWADFHLTAFPSESLSIFDGGSAATDGGDGTVNVSTARFFTNDYADVVDAHVSSSGAIYRLVTGFDADGRPRARFNMPRGTSGDPTSKHYDDLTDDWIEDTYRELPFDRTEVEAAQEERFTIAP